MAEPLLSEVTDIQLGGQDASKIPSLVQPDSYSAGVNVSVAKGILSPRWGVKKNKFTYPSGGIKVPPGNVFISYENIFHSGRFQALIPYTFGSTNYLLIVVNGIIFVHNLDTRAVTVMDIADGSNLNENAERLNWSFAAKFLVIFDYPNFPVIIENLSARRADPAKFEVPVSTLGAYNQNRLFIANAGDEFTAGDPTGNPATPEAPITFEEVIAPASNFLGQVFELPTSQTNATITAMGFLQFVDDSTGIGPLLVASPDMIFAYNTQNPRSTWQPLGQPGNFGSAFVDIGGIVGPRAFTNVNADIFFQSGDGQIRSANMSRNEQKQWSRVPLSREVENWLIFNDKALAQFSVIGYFQNKIFVTVNPFRVSAQTNTRELTFDTAFGGFAVLEIDNLATLGKDGTPAWAGLWTGLRPMDLATIGGKCFIISKDAEFRNEIYEFTPDKTYDQDGENIRYVKSIVYSREYDFKDKFQNKALHSLDLGLYNLQGDFSVDVKFKPAHASNFADWQGYKKIVPWRSCVVRKETCPNGLASQGVFNLTLGTPIDAQKCEATNQAPLESFRKVQLKIILEGKNWELQEYRIKAIQLPQNELETSCDQLQVVEICKECNTDWYIGPFKSCLSQVT